MGGHTMHIDASSLCLLLAIAVLSYLLGYLAGQMQFLTARPATVSFREPLKT